MNRIAAVLFVLFAVLAVAGCRAEHLGPRQGQAYRRAFGRQLANRANAPANQDTADAKRALAAHRSGGKQAAPPQLAPLVLAGGR